MSIDLDKPRYDQSTYMGRAIHFLQLTNPMNALASDKELDEAKRVVTEFRKTRRMPPGYDEEKLWKTKYLYDSAFHPDTGEKMLLIGRMASQAPMNTIITGGMITFYKTTAATVFWQWVNQTFNAVVNYTNRSGDTPMSSSQLFASYCAACGGALGTALYLNSKVKVSWVFMGNQDYGNIKKSYKGTYMGRAIHFQQLTNSMNARSDKELDEAKRQLTNSMNARSDKELDEAKRVVTEFRIDRGKSRYKGTYMGRAIHFQQLTNSMNARSDKELDEAKRLTNPMNALASDKELDEAKRVVTEFRKTRRMPPGYDEEKLWKTKYLYDSAFHPDTGEKMLLIGRMASQAPMNTIITGGMITFYKTTAATVFWQWVNQTFNAVVNYTNRSGDTPMSSSRLLILPLNPSFLHSEILNGTPVFTADGQRVGESKTAAMRGISLVCISRVIMALPGMTLTPLITAYATRRGLFCHYPMAVIPFQLFLVGLCVTFATPLCCAIFPQRAAIDVESLEPELK
ncbi:sideroflexin-1-3-like, partial [Ostrinia furnacalis]|uniref:sideroflexin-1-3-like n=1 Tax=Ostrinia furnacalis TaxID=93504 RepID=UPI00103B3E91